MRTRLRILGATAALSTVAVAVPLLSQSGAEAAHFTGGNLVVYRVGDGAAALSNAAAPVFLDEYTSTGSKVQSLALPTATSGAQHALTAAGQSRSEGLIANSGDGKFVTLTGYDAAPGTLGPAAGTATSTSLANTDPATVGRTVGIVDGDGAVDTSTVLTTGAPKIVRSAVTNGKTVWATGGNGGILATQVGSGTTSVVAGTATSNFTSLTIQGGQLFAGGVLADRLAAVGTGTPTSGATLSDVPGLNENLLTYGYALLDLTSKGYAGTKLDTLYVADAANRGGTVDKYSFDGTAWKLDGYVDVEGATGLVAHATGDSVSIAVTTPSQLLLLTDTKGSATTFAPSTPAVLATAPTGTEFRGVALAPTGVFNPPADQLDQGTYAATDKRIARKGTWKAVKKALVSTKKGSTLTASVNGNALTITFGTGAKGGKVAVTVGGKTTTVSLKAKKTGTLAKAFKLGGGSQKVTIKVVSGSVTVSKVTVK